MTWRDSRVASDGTHHVLRSEPLYAERFDEVLKFHDPGLAPVRRLEEAWHIHPDGSEAYGRRFSRTFGFYEGLAAVTGRVAPHPPRRHRHLHCTVRLVRQLPGWPVHRSRPDRSLLPPQD
jgi:hypothetical protein